MMLEDKDPKIQNKSGKTSINIMHKIAKLKE